MVGAKHWSYPALAMAKCLDQIIKGQKTKIPLGVFHDAQLFLKVVLGRKTGTHFDNPPAQVNAFGIAWDVLNNCPNLRSRTRKGAEGHFLKFAEFLESLEGQPTVPLNEGRGKQPLVPLSTEDQKKA
ncbi:MAG: hypothetical protein Q8N81_03765, partial [bacterium]|nr:hypothetical protein [bacterium]